MTLVAYHSLFLSTVFQTISYKPCHLAIRVRVASFNPIYCRMANDVSIPPNRSAPSLTSWPLKATINRLSALRGGLVLIALTPPAALFCYSQDLGLLLRPNFPRTLISVSLFFTIRLAISVAARIRNSDTVLRS